MTIRQEGDRFVIPCREWAAVHLGLDITYSYKTRRNALRAVHAGKRNQVTKLCHYMQRLYARVCALEITLCRAKKEIDSYDFDAADSISCGDSEAGDSGTAGSGAGVGDSGGRSEGAAA